METGMFVKRAFNDALKIIIINYRRNQWMHPVVGRYSKSDAFSLSLSFSASLSKYCLDPSILRRFMYFFIFPKFKRYSNKKKQYFLNCKNSVNKWFPNAVFILHHKILAMVTGIERPFLFFCIFFLLYMNLYTFIIQSFFLSFF